MTISPQDALAQIQNILDQVIDPTGPEPVDPDDDVGEVPSHRFSGPNAPWNIPAAQIGTHPRNRDHVAQLLKCCDGKVNLNTRPWSPHIRRFNNSTPRVARLQIRQPTWGNLPTNEPVPWDPSWTVPPDDDAYSILIEEGTNRCYVIWQTDYDASSNVLRCGAATEQQESVWRKRTSPADVYKKENGTQTDRACGIYYPALIGTRAEMENGVIMHALGLAIPKPTRGTFRPPATKGAGVMGGPANRSAMGLRFVCDFTDDDINRWADDFDAPLSDHMRTCAVCIRDYGFIIADHGGNFSRKIGSIQLEADDSANWDEIGIPQHPTQSALHSLIKPLSHKIRCLAEPIFPGGNLNRVAVYDGVDYPEGYRG